MTPHINLNSSCIASSPTPRLLRRLSPVLSLLALVTLGALSGCGGGQDFGSFQRNLGGDIGTGYNTSLNSRYGGDNKRTATSVRGTYARIETSFQIEKLPGDPFDYENVNVQVTLRKPDGSTVDVPAFFDGGTTWRMRYTPSASGQYSVVEVKLNKEKGHESNLEKREWEVSGEPQPGFVRIDRGDKQRFVFDSGARYYPIGHNVAWGSDSIPAIPEIFGKMHEAGENWSRVWMNHWDGKNLDWRADGKNDKDKLGQLDLEVAKKWDSIIEGAEKQGVYFQMVLQHHGQVSTEVDPNWADNPYNAEKGGFLKNAVSFFTDPKARALTKRKLYYILARWGYSPSILSFELFNEVEGTDAGRAKLWDDVAMWHKEMALFLRQYDGYQHLLTTSSHPALAKDNPVWETVDYLQTHTYAMDTIAATGATEPTDGKKADKPHFLGEFGAAGLKDPDGITLHNGLWSSMMHSPSGAAQYWDWENIERNKLYDVFKAASSFVKASGLASQGGLSSTALKVETTQRAALRFAPSGGWKKAEENEFVVGASGAPAGIAQFPSFLQGVAKRDMMPKPLTLQVNFAQPGAIKVTVGQVAKQGAKLVVKVDNKATERSYPAADKDYSPKPDEAILSAEVPAGAHTITLQGEGEDWVVLKEIALTDYAPALAAPARVGKDYAIAWVYHRDNVDIPKAKESGLQPATGSVTVPGLQTGRYQATWWNTQTGASIDSTAVEVTKDAKTITLNTPPITRDVALYITKTAKEVEKSVKSEKDKGKASAQKSVPAPKSDAAKSSTR